MPVKRKTLTVPSAMLAVAVVAGDLVLFALTHWLRACLRAVPVLVAVMATHLAAVHGIASVVEASKNLLLILRPPLALTGTRGLDGEAD